VQVVLSDFDCGKFGYGLLQSEFDFDFDCTLQTRYLAVNRFFCVRFSRIVTRDFSYVDRASTAAIVSLVVDINIAVVDVVGPVAAHASLE